MSVNDKIYVNNLGVFVYTREFMSATPRNAEAV